MHSSKPYILQARLKYLYVAASAVNTILKPPIFMHMFIYGHSVCKRPQEGELRLYHDSHTIHVHV